MSQLPGFSDPTITPDGQTAVRFEDLSPAQQEAARRHYARQPKRLSEMTAAEIKAQWQADRPGDFSPVDEHGRDVSDPAYQMPLSELKAKADEEARQAAAKELDERRSATAVTFMHHERRWKPTAKNAEIMEAELNRRGLVGTVSDLQAVFNDLAAEGKLSLNPAPLTPARIYTEQELREMPLADARAAIAEMARNGIY